jgi:hypothetical protein
MGDLGGRDGIEWFCFAHLPISLNWWHGHSVQDRLPAEVRHDHPPDDPGIANLGPQTRSIAFGSPIWIGLGPPISGLAFVRRADQEIGVPGGVPLVQGHERLFLVPGRPFEPPGQIDEPLRQGLLQRRARDQLVQQVLPVLFEFPLVFPQNGALPGKEAMLQGVLGGRFFALRGMRTGGLLGIGTIGLDLYFRRHKFPSASKS